MEEKFIVRLYKKPPIVFPLVALYHCFVLGIHLYYSREDFTSQANLLETLWLLLSIVFLVFVCDLKRWAALGYIGLTLLGMILQFSLPPGNLWHDLGTTALFPVDLLITVFLLFYYKRFK